MTRLGVRAASGALGLAALAAGLAPLRPDGRPASAAVARFPGWPTQYDGHALTELPLSPREQGFAQDFPGRIARFTDGRRELVIRWIDVPTRRLHPASDCLRAVGYAITPVPARRGPGGSPMGCFRARRGAESLTVCERVHDSQDASWPDVSSWYWHAVLGTSPAPWWSVVVAERD